MPKEPHEIEFWRELSPGRAIRIRATVFEYGMPTPGEADEMRAPNGEETITLIKGAKMEDISLKKPF